MVNIRSFARGVTVLAPFGTLRRTPGISRRFSKGASWHPLAPFGGLRNQITRFSGTLRPADPAAARWYTGGSSAERRRTMQPAAPANLDDPALYINPDLSWP